MSYEPIITNSAMIFKLRKPVWGSEFGIWDKWLKMYPKKIIVIETQFGKVTFENAKEYMAKAERKKHVHFQPDNPMIFYHRSLLSDIKERDKRKKQEEVSYEQYKQTGGRLAELARKNPIIAEAMAKRSWQSSHY